MNSEYLSLREIQLEELEILKKVTNYLQDRKLKYFLAGGTLLGVIRHKGFIPWDDDIDIFIPRADYEKFLEYSKKELIDSSYEVLALENNNYGRAFCKVVNKNIPIESTSIEDKYLWIDIFPLDVLPESLEESKKIIKKSLFIKGQIYLRTTKCKEILKEKKSLSNRILKLILKPISYRHNLVYYSKKIRNIAKKYEDKISDKVGDIVWPDGYQSIFKKEWFENTIKGEFEQILFDIPSGWNEYLKHLYGDYMKLPDENKREAHNIIAKKNK